jgi:hypothetical protein
MTILTTATLVNLEAIILAIFTEILIVRFIVKIFVNSYLRPEPCFIIFMAVISFAL